MSGDDTSKERSSVRMDELVSLCARRGFIFQSGEIYGGINGFWDYGPLGVELKNNLKALWWQRVVRERDDVEGIDSAIITHPAHLGGLGPRRSTSAIRWWTASACKKRFRADQLDDAGPCPAREGTSEHDFTEPRDFNLMLKTFVGASEDAAAVAYLRAETCGSIFTDFKRVREVSRQKIPFGIAQIGKAFRNEINPRNFIFRSREFEQAELEFFCHPSESAKWFDALAGRAHPLPSRARLRRASAARRPAHDARALREGGRRHRVPVPVRLAGDRGQSHDRGSYDLAPARRVLGQGLVGARRGDEGALRARRDRDVRRRRPHGARAALQRVRGGEARRRRDARGAAAAGRASRRSRWRCCRSRRSSPSRAQRIAGELRKSWNTFYDEAGNIGRRYRRQDEVGTPYCVTFDFESEGDQKVTVRERDSMTQDRMPLVGLSAHLRERLDLSGERLAP